MGRMISSLSRKLTSTARRSRGKEKKA